MTYVRTWQRRRLAAVRARIRNELATISVAEDRSARLTHALESLRRLDRADDEVTGDALRIHSMERYVYAVNALLEIERLGGRRRRQADHLVDLAHGVLRSAGIDADSRYLGSLYGDLHLLRSQILRRGGGHWAAAWDHGLATRFSFEKAERSPGFQTMIAANRALRVGDATLAIEGFEAAERLGLRSDTRQRSRLGLAQAWRLSGRADAARSVVEEALLHPEVGPDLRMELEWLRTLLSTERPEVEALLAMTRRDGSHFEAGYILEASLHAFASPRLDHAERVRKISGMTRNKNLRPRDYGFLFDATLTLQQGYDDQYPLVWRLQRVGRVLAERGRLMNIDKELLVLAAAARWLKRVRSDWLMRLCASEYHGLCYRLSGGRCNDTLGLLLDRPAS